MSQPDVVTLTPEGERLAVDIEALAQIVEGATGGWTRRVFSDAYRAAREFVCDRMRDAGLEASIDAAGNVVGRLPGRDPGAPPLVTGSHTDTVNGAGRFDGMVGVLGAIESVRVLRERGVSLHHDLLVMDFLGEEANPLACPVSDRGPSRDSSPRTILTSWTHTPGSHSGLRCVTTASIRMPPCALREHPVQSRATSNSTSSRGRSLNNVERRSAP